MKVIGSALILLGLAGLALNAGQTDPLSWALWFGGVVLAHDLLLLPLALAVGVLARRARLPYRVALVIGAMVTIVALPVVLGFGRRADNPSQLPQDYAVNLAVVLGSLLVLALAADLLMRRRPAKEE